MENRIIVCAGISMPYFPPRPATGAVVKSVADYATFDTSSHVIQGKLNGDRAGLLVLGGKTYIQNRHGSWYKHTVDARDTFLQLDDCTLMDGEVWQKRFYPFETVVEGGKSLMFTGPEVREASAKAICKRLGIPYLFDPLSPEATGWKAPTWEGYVLKKRGSFYLPLGSDGQITKEWTKRKWIL